MMKFLKGPRENGQSMVEMAIMAPLLIFFILGIFEVGATIRNYLTLVNVNREITRYAVRPGYLDFSTPANVQTSFAEVQDWTFGAISEQLQLDFDNTGGGTTLIISHMVVDTGLPCADIQENPDSCNCDAFDPNSASYDPNYGYPLDDLILHPGIPGQEYQTASFGPAATSTGSRPTRLNYEDIVTDLAAKNNKFNCEVIKKGGAVSSNNVVVTELYHDLPQLFGFPIISNPYTDPVPLYTHTSMRLINGARGFTLETTGPVCVAYPITFHENILDNPQYPIVPQPINLFEGDDTDEFGWITWNPNSAKNTTDYVVEELKNPRLSVNDYTNATDTNDNNLSIYDNVSTKPNGISDSGEIEAQLQLLVGKEITVPVRDNNPGDDADAYYHISHYARIRVEYTCVPGVCDGEVKKQIKATFLGYVDDVCNNSSGINNTPIAVDDGPIYISNTNPGLAISVLKNDSDPNGDPISIVNTSQPSNGTATVNGNGTITYIPNSGYIGPDSFTYIISDGNGGTDSATVSITVSDGPVNNPPDAADDNAVTDPDTAVTINVIANDSDIDGNSLSVIEVRTAANGEVVNNNDGTVTYTPETDYLGPDTFTYTISDGNGGTDTATVTVSVGAPNIPPTANNDSLSVVINTPVTINVISNDSDEDDDPLTVTDVQISPSDGSVTNNGDGTVTFTPIADQTGVKTFTYTISDGNGGTDTATVTITVNQLATPTPTPTNTPVPGAPAITSLILINADTNTDIGPLTNGMTIDLAVVSKLSVRAETNPSPTGSVWFNMSGDDNFDRIEGKQPYAMLGDSGGTIYSPWEPAPGSYTLTVTPYSESNQGGTAGNPYIVHFTVVNSAPTPAPSPTSTAVPPSAVTKEAETMSLSNYTVEALSFASGGQAIRVVKNTTGSAWFTFNGTAGNYNISVYYFDENDGQTTFTLFVNNVQKDQWVANQNLGAGGAESFTLTSRTKTNVTLAPGNVIKLTGTYQGDEYARIDKVVITPN